MCNCDNRIDDEQPSKIALMAEYHRGFVDGCNLRETATWQLSMERDGVVRELRELDGCSPLAHGFRDALAAAIDVPRNGAPYDDKELCHLICDRLIHLLDGTPGSHTCLNRRIWQIRTVVA